MRYNMKKADPVWIGYAKEKEKVGAMSHRSRLRVQDSTRLAVQSQYV